MDLNSTIEGGLFSHDYKNSLTTVYEKEKLEDHLPFPLPFPRLFKKLQNNRTFPKGFKEK